MGASRESRMVVVKRDGAGTPVVWCDPEIADLVSALNQAGIATIASCSGHGYRPGRISLKDGREIILPRNQRDMELVEAQFPTDINGRSRVTGHVIGGVMTEDTAAITVPLDLFKRLVVMAACEAIDCGGDQEREDVKAAEREIEQVEALLASPLE